MISLPSGAIEWSVSRHSGHLAFFYGDRYRNDQLDETWARTVITSGVGGTGDLAVDIDEIRQTIGIVDGDTDLNSYLTNKTNYFPFVDLPDATPSVVEALNVLNAQIGAELRQRLRRDGIIVDIEGMEHGGEGILVMRRFVERGQHHGCFRHDIGDVAQPAYVRWIVTRIQTGSQF